ncbi:hypothetical protein [Azospirillum sp. ST 5-10]|uniref:hypothetical protein n=1 Tax=unclassified Azospirillum TaxID=2630922 RepID=UPI003F4A421A
MIPSSLVAEQVAADVALTLAGYAADVQILALEVYDRLVEDLLVGRGLPREDAAGLAADTVRRVRARLETFACGGGGGGGRA